MTIAPETLAVPAQYFNINQEKLEEILSRLGSIAQGLEIALERAADLLAPLAMQLGKIAAAFTGLPAPMAANGFGPENLDAGNAPPQAAPLALILDYLARFEPILNALQGASDRCAQTLDNIAAALAGCRRKRWWEELAKSSHSGYI